MTTGDPGERRPRAAGLPRESRPRVRRVPASTAIHVFRAIDVDHQACEKARTILERTHESAAALLKAFDLLRTPRGRRTARVGMTTDEEQDVLRAMLVMAAAGLDAMTKQLIRDALPLIAHRNSRARAELEKFLARQFAVDVQSITAGRSARFVAGLLSASDLPSRAVALYVEDLTAGSLQSAEELSRIAAAFGLTREDLGTNFEDLRDIFRVRNKIIHDLDVNLEAAGRVRNMRTRPRMAADANALLQASEDLLRAINNQLSGLGAR